MKNCLFCNSELTHVPGRKEKSFCNSKCRNSYFYQKSQEAKKVLPLPISPVQSQKVSAIDKKGVVKPLTFQKPIKKAKEVADSDDLKESIEWAAPTPEAYDSPKIPKTLDDVKSMCPKELTGFDRSAWIATERQKYGI